MNVQLHICCLSVLVARRKVPQLLLRSVARLESTFFTFATKGGTPVFTYMYIEDAMRLDTVAPSIVGLGVFVIRFGKWRLTAYA